MIEILNIKQVNKNIYKIIFSNNEEIDIYDEVIIKFNLIVGNLVQEKFVKEIKKYNEVIVIFFKYRNKLLRRIESTYSISNKLKKEKLSNEDTEEIIIKLKKINLLNDDLFLENYIINTINLSLDGPNKIIKNLLEHGINEEKIIKKLDKYDELFWKSRIKKIIIKRNKSNHKDSFKIYSYKLKNYIYNLGYDYSYEIIYNEEKELEIIKNEYTKLIIKKKNSNIDEILIKKGFRYEDIKKLEKQ